MKVLLFTHEQDIDGMGCAVLGKVAFSDLEIVPCKTFEITNRVKEYIDSGRIYIFDRVFVTDLCIKEPLLTFINKDAILKERLRVIDHHKTEIEEGNDKYDFVNITVSIDGIKRSGTSLFYDYLVQHNFITPTPVLNEFAEWTRQYDVWDWQKNNNPNARKLHVLFETLDLEYYVPAMLAKVRNQERINFTPYEEGVVSDFDRAMEEELVEIIAGMKVRNLDIVGETFKVGYVKTPYKYRNDINERIMCNNLYDIDAVGMVMTDMDTVSYRQVKDVDVSKIGEYYGGKGHRGASSHYTNSPKFESVLESLGEDYRI